MELALKESESGTANYSYIGYIESFTKNNGYRGHHTTECSMRSTNHDYLLKNGMITNSLSAFYLQYYRKSIPPSEMNKVNRLYLFYKKNRNPELMDFKSKYIPRRISPIWTGIDLKLCFEDDDDQPME